MDPLPTCLSLRGRKCLVTGSSTEAMRQAFALHDSGALITIVCAKPATSSAPPGSQLHTRGFRSSDLDDCWLVIAGSENAAENRTILKQCEARRIFCHSVEDPSSGTLLYGEKTPEQHSHASHHLTTQNNGQSAHHRSQSGSGASQAQNGFVSLVGAGPGDPDLLTLRALKLIQSADVIVHDRLVSPQILKLCRAEAEFIYAGKAKSNHAIPQDSINHLLVDLAQQKRQVVRLKGGDPFIFGRGGEEIETLAEHKIPFQVVPGITAASGCAAFAGIPLTHRAHAQSCVFVTGHLKDGQINLNWRDLRDPAQTIVVYMGLTGVQRICESLIYHGRTKHTPAALVERGTTQHQRVLSGTLATLPGLVATTEVVAPTLLIIGGVVTLRDKLAWFETDH